MLYHAGPTNWGEASGLFINAATLDINPADNAAALDSHRQSAHFKKYAATTKDMVTKRDARPMTSVAMNSKGR